MSSRHGYISVVILLLAGCTEPAPPSNAEQQFVEDAVAALGGRAALESVATISIRASGRMPNIGQDLTPESATMEFDLSDYSLAVDLARRASRTEFTRTPLFDYFRGRDPMRLVSGYDDGIAWDLAPDGSASRAHDDVAADRRSGYYHHPLPLMRAVIADGAKVRNARNESGLTVADISTADGELLTMAIDDETHLPAFIRSTDHHPYLRDVVRRTRFSDYGAVGSLVLPSSIRQTLDEFEAFRLTISSQEPNADVGDVDAPADAAGAAPVNGTPPANVVAERVAEGVWLLAGQSHHSVLIEFRDHLMVIEAPNESRLIAVIGTAGELVPGKPVTKLVNTHHHFDHSGGIRAAISRGLTIITQAANGAFYRRMAGQPSTIVPDALAAEPQPIKLEVVGEHRTYEDEAMTVELFHVADNPHSSSMLMAYLPEYRMLVQVDLYTTGRTTPQLFAPNLVDNIERYGLDVETVLSLHGDTFDYTTLVAAVDALRGSAGEN